MAAFFQAGALVIAAVLLPFSVVMCGFPATTMTLERAFPTNHGVHELGQLRARDRIRHGRMLQSSNGGVIDFPVGGTFNPFLVGYSQISISTLEKKYIIFIFFDDFWA